MGKATYTVYSKHFGGVFGENGDEKSTHMGVISFLH